MRGKSFQYVDIHTGRDVDSVELARQQYKEECELRLARIQNGKEPSHKNGPWEAAQKIANISKDTRLAGSPRKARL